MGFAIASIIAQGVSSTISAVQQVSEGYNRAANYENQARAADANARIAAMNASIAESQGKIEASQTAQDGFKQLGRQRAAMAQGGVLESPTGLLVRQEAEERTKDDLFQVKLQSDLKKQGYEFQAADLRSSAQVARSNARYAKISGWMGGISTLAGGAAQGMGSYGMMGF